MIDPRCLGPDVDISRIAADARITGASYLTGRRTSVGSGAVIHNSRVHDAVIEAGAHVEDSLILAEGHPHRHKCDAAGRTVVGAPDQPSVAHGAIITGSTLVNTAVGADSRVSDSWTGDVTIGQRCRIDRGKLVLTTAADDATVSGPTEISEAYLGHHATIDGRGYLEGVFSNAFRKLAFNAQTGKLEVVEVIDLPHVSRYGINTINSTNSGKLLPQPGGVLKELPAHEGLWTDRLLSHEQIELSPCCWVLPWTKVVGQSPAAHADECELVNDEFMTYLMPFSLAGWQGELTRGRVMPGELSVGLGTKQRQGAWVFTYAPELVFDMVRRLHAALPDGRKHVADRIVLDAVDTALAMTQELAFRNRVDLSVPLDRQKSGWPRWLGRTWALLRAHREGGLWTFRGAEPVGWTRDSGRWTHPELAAVLAIAPDALDNQVPLGRAFHLDDPVPPSGVAVPAGAEAGTGEAAEIAPDAVVQPGAVVLPGSRIGAGCVIESGAVVWSSTLERTRVASGARIERSILTDAQIGPRALVRSCRVEQSALGGDSNATGASVLRSQLGERTTLSMFADLCDARCRHATIWGGQAHDVTSDVYLMSMHMAGTCRHLIALPTPVMVEGKSVSVPAIPMIGGGSVIRGSADRPVRLECSFIGSNAILEPGTYVGLGCFVLGRLGPDAGLLPFTFSFGPEPAMQQIGGVLQSAPSTILTHFVNWTFQALGPSYAPAVGQLVRQGIRDGLAAVEWELARRAGNANPAVGAAFAKYASLAAYTPEQLEAGLSLYRRALDSGAWEMTYAGDRLVFSSPRGQWTERNGSALWKSV